MQLYIIRHCQSKNNALWAKNGSSDGRLADPPLTDIGHLQAEHLAQFVAGGSDGDDDLLNRYGIDLTHLYCSLMSRSIETGLYIARSLDLPLVAREDIHERGGIYLRDSQTNERNGLPGPNRDHFRLHFPAVTLPDSLGAEGWWNRPYEDQDAALLRGQRFLDWLMATHGGTEDRVAMVTHAGFAQSLFGVLFGASRISTNLGKDREIWFKFNNGSITRLDFEDEFIRLDYQNRVEFIPGHLLT